MICPRSGNINTPYIRIRPESRASDTTYLAHTSMIPGTKTAVSVSKRGILIIMYPSTQRTGQRQNINIIIISTSTDHILIIPICTCVIRDRDSFELDTFCRRANTSFFPS